MSKQLEIEFSYNENAASIETALDNDLFADDSTNKMHLDHDKNAKTAKITATMPQGDQDIFLK